ncbi:hypothetical protein FV232_03880 [Methylobacterium sp. WL30]|nr:hypothetical protein FV223_08250 [Methylobacterium sp. WL116]TXN34651.1 hypothetical protein FV225_15775 [Methylobacterium sp. WL93]TXN52622.1 hypothetical protein FV227_02210 [Methylobacterium sp. WL119]TXN70014.1 hypothetical protein FV232_03880 [Methylobacterium sp. WL30]
MAREAGRERGSATFGNVAPLSRPSLTRGPPSPAAGGGRVRPRPRSAACRRRRPRRCRRAGRPGSASPPCWPRPRAA